MYKKIALIISIFTLCTQSNLQAAAHDEPTLEEKRIARHAIYEARIRKSYEPWEYLHELETGEYRTEFPPPPTWNNDTDLLWSIFFNNRDAVTDLLKEEIDVQKLHHVGPHRCTSLYYAVDQINAPVVLQLLQAGADPNIPSNMQKTRMRGRTAEHYTSRETPLFKAVTLACARETTGKARIEIVEHLVCHKADPKITSGIKKRTPLHAIAQDHCIRNDDAFPLIRLLLDAGANRYQNDADKLTPIAAALNMFSKYTELDPDIAPMFAARAAFIKAYPGKTELQRIAIERTLLFCSFNDEVRAQAVTDIKAIRIGERGVALQTELEQFLPDFPVLLSGYFDRGQEQMELQEFTHNPMHPDGRISTVYNDQLAWFSTLKPYIYCQGAMGSGICHYPLPISKSASVFEIKEKHKPRTVTVHRTT